jgi:hypothetical protein
MWRRLAIVGLLAWLGRRKERTRPSSATSVEEFEPRLIELEDQARALNVRGWVGLITMIVGGLATIGTVALGPGSIETQAAPGGPGVGIEILGPAANPAKKGLLVTRGVRKLGHASRVVGHAAASYSWMRPPSSSCLRMCRAGAPTGAEVFSSGGCSESERCGRCRL